MLICILFLFPIVKFCCVSMTIYIITILHQLRLETFNYFSRIRYISLDCFFDFHKTFCFICYIGRIEKLLIVSDDTFSSPDICWEIGLKRFINEALDFSSLELEINNLNEKDQIYLEENPDFTDGNLCNLKQITFEYEICQEIKW